MAKSRWEDWLMDSAVLEFLKSFEGWICRDLSAGVIGSVFYLFFEDPSFELDAPKRSNRMRPRPGEMVLNVWCAAWRIEDLANMKILATFDDDNSPGGPLLTGLERLIGKSIEQIILEEPGLDCEITFEQGLRLSIFPFGVESASSSNYVIWNCERSFSVGARSIFSFPREDGP